MNETPKVRERGNWAVAAAALALAFLCPRAVRADSTVHTPGITEASNQRKIISTKFGYFVFYSTGANSAYYAFSKDGDNWT